MKLKSACIFLLLASLTLSVFAHEGVTDLENLTRSETLWLYLQSGFNHIIPLGMDHILFILCLFLGSRNLRSLLIQATTFTIAHTVTLGLSMFSIIQLPSHIIEPVISASIVFMSLQLLFVNSSTRSKLAIIFLFGLVHGLGFAGALQEYGMPKNHFFSSLVVFNLGVELGQISVIVIAYLFLGWWAGKWSGYRNWVVVPMSLVIALIAGWWTFERLVFA
jgi:HupE / UreJ protein